MLMSILMTVIGLEAESLEEQANNRVPQPVLLFDVPTRLVFGYIIAVLSDCK
jgi:hypothetical protein